MTLLKPLKIILAAMLLVSMSTQASLIITGLDSDAYVIDFEDQAAQQGISSAVQIGNAIGEDVTVSSSNSANGLYFNYNGWGLGENGTWKEKTYVALDGSEDAMIFAFNDGAVSSVGGFMNYAPGPGGNDLIISALNINGELLESYNLSRSYDIQTRNEVNGGAFRGIERTTNDIAFFKISGGWANTLDDFSFSRASNVPEPASMLMLVLGLSGMLFRRRSLKN